MSEVPSDARSLNALACRLRQQGRFDEALSHFRRAVELAPEDPVVRGNLGQMLLNLGRFEEAVPHCRAAARQWPGQALLHLVLGDALRCAGQFPEAKSAYLEAVRLRPNLAPAHANLGLLFGSWKRTDEALAPLRRAVELEPANATYWRYLAEALADWDDFAESIRCWNRAVELQPDQPAARLGLASSLLEVGRDAEAEDHVTAALRLRPDLADAHLALSRLREQQGDPAGAEAASRQALRLNPGLTAAWVGLSRLLRGRLPDADREAIEHRLAETQLPEGCRIKLSFEMAAVHDARGDHRRAAEYARAANALNRERSRRLRGYDPERHRQFIDDLIKTFAADFFRRTAGFGDRTRRPVFVVGLPRSGTTLVEQILASHPRIHGAGELRFAFQSLMAVPEAVGRPGDDPLACVPALDAGAVRALAGRYLTRLNALDDGRHERVVDKLPANYQYLGLLATLFPEAVFVHCRRDVRDVAVSCWMTDFRWIEWASDVSHIASRVADYRRLMTHWRDVLPVPVHEVNYEELVADVEGTARRLVAACGLEWEPACREFHRTRRPVRTASASQVRVPIYTKSVGRWRHYQEELADLFRLLE